MRHLCLTFALCLLMISSACRPDAAPSTSTAPATSPKETPAENIMPATDELSYMPGERFGKITGSTHEGDLKFLYGERILPAKVDIGEGFTTPGYRLFPGTRNEVDIMLPNEENGIEQFSAMVRNQDSQWRMPGSSLAIGTSLADLEKLNGQPITFLGLEWDYAGTVTSWNGGALEGLGVTLDYDIPVGAQLPTELVGDVEINSSAPELKGADFWVSEITVPLTPPEYNEDGIPTTTDFAIVPGYRFGALTVSATPEDLPLVYGAGNVEPMDYELPGGVSVPGFRLFSGTKNEVEIGFPDEDNYLEGIEFRIGKEGSDWHLAGTDIRVGDHLTEVRNINRKPIMIYSHNMENGGQVNSWGGGRLVGTSMEFDTNADGKNYEYNEEMEVSSDTEAVKKSDPKVSMITLYLER